MFLSIFTHSAEANSADTTIWSSCWSSYQRQYLKEAGKFQEFSSPCANHIHCFPHAVTCVCLFTHWGGISPCYHCPNVLGWYFKTAASFIFQTDPQALFTLYTLQHSSIFLFFPYGWALFLKLGRNFALQCQQSEGGMNSISINPF